MPVGALDVKYSIAQTQLKGEDVAVVPQDKLITSYFGNCVVFAICDGHGGSQASSYFGRHLEEVLQKNLNCDLLESALQQGVENVAQILRSCLHAVFLQLDKDFAINKNSSAGTTATVIVVYGRLVTIANVGDSKALLVLPEQDAQHEISEDHRIHENQEERDRMVLSGAEIAKTKVGDQYMGILRVWPAGLALSRSIGDRRAKPHVVPHPHITQIILPTNQKSRIVLASDGLWDDLTCEEVSYFTQIKKLEQLPQKLIKKAIYSNKGRLADDITVVAISLKPVKRTRGKIFRSTRLSQKNISKLESKNFRQLQQQQQQQQKQTNLRYKCNTNNISNVVNLEIENENQCNNNSNNVNDCVCMINNLVQQQKLQQEIRFQNLNSEISIPVLSIDTLKIESKQYYDVLMNIQRCSGSSGSMSSYNGDSNRQIDLSPFQGLKISPTKFVKKRVQGDF